MMFNRKRKKTHTLVSAHIPKSGGTSFRQLLETNYKPKNSVWIYDHVTSQALADSNLSNLEIEPRRIDLIHGHFHPKRKVLEQLDQPFLITWLRDPVERMISLYSFWQQLEPQGMGVHDKFLEEQPTIEEFATWPEVVEEVHNYFGEIPLEEYDFVGTIENYSADLEVLAQKLGWKNRSISWVNQTSNKASVTNEQRRRFSKVLAESVELYERARSS